MNNNRIRPTSTNLDVQSFIRRCDIAYDERARYVEFVCSVWNEGRFGRDLADLVTVKRNDRPEREPMLFSDLLDDKAVGPIRSTPCYDVRLLGRAGYRAVEPANRSVKRSVLLATLAIGSRPMPHPASNQGRGSPLNQRNVAPPDHQRRVVLSTKGAA